MRYKHFTKTVLFQTKNNNKYSLLIKNMSSNITTANNDKCHQLEKN